MFCSFFYCFFSLYSLLYLLDSGHQNAIHSALDIKFEIMKCTNLRRDVIFSFFTLYICDLQMLCYTSCREAYIIIICHSHT